MYTQLENTMISYISTLNKLKIMKNNSDEVNIKSVINEALKDIEKIGGSVRLIEGDTLTLININENNLISKL